MFYEEIIVVCCEDYVELSVVPTVHHSISENETNVMHFSFSLLRIKGLYMFRALLVHPQEVLHKLKLQPCILRMSK
jgi:hypothetical protein